MLTKAREQCALTREVGSVSFFFRNAKEYREQLEENLENAFENGSEDIEHGGMNGGLFLSGNFFLEEFGNRGKGGGSEFAKRPERKEQEFSEQLEQPFAQ